MDLQRLKERKEALLRSKGFSPGKTPHYPSSTKNAHQMSGNSFLTNQKHAGHLMTGGDSLMTSEEGKSAFN